MQITVSFSPAVVARVSGQVLGFRPLCTTISLCFYLGITVAFVLEHQLVLIHALIVKLPGPQYFRPVMYLALQHQLYVVYFSAGIAARLVRAVCL
jgi:hypothetical protein